MLAQTRAMAREARAVSIPSAQSGVSVRAVIALGRIEARRILLHPALLGAAGLFALMIFVVVGQGGPSGGSEAGARRINPGFLGVGLAFGLAVGGLIASNLAGQRARRDHMLELYGSLPTPPETRTAAVTLGALVGPVLLATILTVILDPLLSSDGNIGRYIHPSLVVQFPMTVAAFCAIGIGLARWVPSLIAAPIVIIAHFVTPIAWAAPWITPSESDVRMPWHLAYLVGVIVTWIALAFLRDRRTPLRIALTVAAFLVASYSVVHQYPPGGLNL